MKNLFIISIITIISVFVSCKKDKDDENTPVAENYTSIDDFFVRNDVPLQTYVINATTGGSFTTNQGTIVQIPSNAFLSQSGLPVTGDITILFKDIYKKSDMLLSNMPTMQPYGEPLKSGGEFFIKVLWYNYPVNLITGKSISVSQPVNLTDGIDSINTPLPFNWVPDFLVQSTYGWFPSASDSLFVTASNYIYKLFEFTTPLESGTWLNCDNSTFFSSYPQTVLTLNPIDSMNVYQSKVFLIFNSVTTVVRLYYDVNGFQYYYAPVGLECTAVAIGVKDGELYSAFVPMTITSNLILDFKPTKTTTEEFKAQLEALN